MQAKIGLQIAGSDPGFTIFFSENWEGEALTHSSERKSSVEPVYYEAVFGPEHWTYVAVHCNFLSNANREECFKIGLRIPARHELTGSDGEKISPVSVLDRIYESVKSTALTRRGADTWRLRTEPVFDADGYAAILGEYGLRPVWGVAAQSREDDSVVFLELGGTDPAVPLLHVPFLTASWEGSKVCLGSFTDDIDKYLFSPVDLKAAPFVKVRAEGRDRFYEYIIEPGKQLRLSASDCGYSEEEYEPVSVLLDCDTIVSTCGSEIGGSVGAGVCCHACVDDGLVVVKFFPQLRNALVMERPVSSLLVVRVGASNKTVRLLKIRIDSNGGSVREIVCPCQAFERDGSEMNATIELSALTDDENIVVCLDSPATAECIAFIDDNGVFVADFVRHGRKRNFFERFCDVMGLGNNAEVSGKWQAVRWIVIIVLAAMLILGGTVLAKLAGSVIKGALPFIDKIR